MDGSRVTGTQRLLLTLKVGKKPDRLIEFTRLPRVSTPSAKLQLPFSFLSVCRQPHIDD